MAIIISTEIMEFILEIIKWITPVVLFFLAYSIDSNIKRKKEKRNSELKYDMILSQMRLLNKQILSQKDQLLDCIRRLQSNEIADLRVTKVTGSYLNRFNKMSFQSLFEIFVSEKISRNSKNRELNEEVEKNFDRLQSAIDYLSESFDLIFRNQGSKLAQINEYVLKIGASHSKTIVYRNSLVSQPNSDQDDFIVGFAAILSDYENQKENLDNNYFKAYELLVEKLIEFCKANQDPRSVYLMKLQQEYKAAYLQTCEFRKELAESHLDTARTMMKEYRIIKRLIQFYEQA